MPIKPENKARYPKNWNEISQEVRRRADYKCEFCGVENHILGGRDGYGLFHKALPLGENAHGLEWPKPGTTADCEGKYHLKIFRIVLTVAHLDHQPENCEPGNLKALCQRCHLAYDAKHHRTSRLKCNKTQDLLTN